MGYIYLAIAIFGGVQRAQGGPGVRGHQDLPLAAAEAFHVGLEQFEELRVVIHKEDGLAIWNCCGHQSIRIGTARERKRTPPGHLQPLLGAKPSGAAQASSPETVNPEGAVFLLVPSAARHPFDIRVRPGMDGPRNQ